MRTFARLLVVSFCATMAQSATIVGIGNGDMSFPGILYSVDPITGAVTPVGPAGVHSGYIPISSSPVAGSYFAISPVNHYNLSYPQAGAFNTPGFASWECGCVFNNQFTFDYAYDSSNGKLFTILEQGGSQNFAQLIDTGTEIPGRPASHALAPSIIRSSSDFSATLIMEVVQGLGLYATDGHNAFLIDENTGTETPLPSLAYAGPTITGLAYDPDSGRLIGTAGMFNPPPGMTGYIYSINPLSGQVTVLNSHAPDMIGLAAVLTPEPPTALLLACGFLCLWLGAARRRSHGEAASSAGSRYTNG